MRLLIPSKMFCDRFNNTTIINIRQNTIFLVFLQYLIAISLTLFLLILITHAWNLNIHIPLRYQGDAIFNSMVIKSIIDTGWCVKNPNIGVPGGYNLADFPIMDDNFHLSIMKILTFFTSDYAVILNLFFIFTFISATITALFVFKRFDLKYPVALTASLLFSLLPYHFFRGENHLFLSSYYIIPIVIWISVIAIPSSEQKTSFKKKYFSWIIYFILCVLIGSSGIYYAFFGIFFMLLSGFISSVIQRNWFSIIKATIFTVSISIVFFINILPYFINNFANGSNPLVAHRLPQESEMFGLKIFQLLLPIDFDRMDFLANFKEKYNQSGLLVNENADSSLGMIASIGFLILLGVIFFKKNSVVNNIKQLNKLELISKLNLGAVLSATIGGFGAIFAYTLSPMIRGYNRMSIYIAFFSLYAFFFMLQRMIKKAILPDNKYMYVTLSLLILVIGIYRQTPTHSHLFLPNSNLIVEFQNDKNFIHQIEMIFPHNSNIFQLPYVPFPENGDVNKMGDYEHFKPYLHSHYLKWSYGATKGRPVDLWQKNMSSLPVPEMLKSLIAAGFTGIYLNRNGYLDNGKNIESQLTKLLGQHPLVSENNQLFFYDLRNYADRLKKNMT